MRPRGLSEDPAMGAEPSETASVPSSSLKKSFAFLFERSTSSPFDILVIFPSASHKGKPSLKIPKSAIVSMSKHLQFTLIGKFSHDRPTMERSRLFFF